jgi:hypothetical protein
MPLWKYERVRRPFRTTGLKLFAKGNLFRAQALFTVNGSPTGGGVATAKELLVDTLVAGTAVPSRQMSTDHESVMIDFLLTGSGLMAVEAIHTLLRMRRHFVLMNHRILEPGMALRALAGGADEVGRRLGRLDTWALPVDQKGGQNQCECDNDSQKY